MKPGRVFVILCAAMAFPLHGMLWAQGESAVPFLLIAPDPAGNGWGGVSTAVVSDNPTASIVNPGQLGLLSLDTYFAASMYAPKTRWFPQYALPDLTYDVTAVNGGVNLARTFGLGLPISIGVGYSRVHLNLGTFAVTSSNGPQVIAKVSSWEQSECFSLGAGIDYFVRLGIGMNYERIESNLAPIVTEQGQTTGKANGTAVDLGVLLEIPVIDIIGKLQEKPVTCGWGLTPVANISAGYARQNHGNSITYMDVAMSDPLPRNAVVGLSTEIGLALIVDGEPWKVFAFTLAREAEDLLVVRHADGTFEYQSGLGDISFFKHIIQGRLNDDERPELHKGWQLAFGDAVFVRGGTFLESPRYGNRHYATLGYGIRLGGFLRLLSAVAPEYQPGDVLSFIAAHIDLAYDHAEYSTSGPLSSTAFNAVSIVIR